jgi:hypothetical protein
MDDSPRASSEDDDGDGSAESAGGDAAATAEAEAVAATDDAAVEGDDAAGAAAAADDGGDPDAEAAESDAAAAEPADGDEGALAELSEDELRERVEEEYDFDDFGPADMAEMSPEEWEVAFDADTWITGDDLLDRVRQDLETKVATRDVFAVLEEVEQDGQRCLLAYSDEDYALVYPDGSVEGFGTLLRDVKPIVALCSMEGYEPDTPPESANLPDPEDVPEGSGEFGNLMLQIIAGVQGVAGLALLAGAVLVGSPGPGQNIGSVLMIVLGLGFVIVSVLLFGTVANARLSDKFRAEQYRERLRAVGLEDGERPEFLPLSDPDEEESD